MGLSWLVGQQHSQVDGPASVAYFARPVKKAKPLPHRNRGKSSRHRAKLKAKHRRVRLRRSSGQRKTYR